MYQILKQCGIILCKQQTVQSSLTLHYNVTACAPAVLEKSAPLQYLAKSQHFLST